MGAMAGTKPGVAPTPFESMDELVEGTLVGEYRIKRKIGEGGMGVVYSAVHPIIGKRAAVKVISRAMSDRRESIQRFVQEAQAVNQIAYPNIVDIFSFGTLSDGRSYFVMRLPRSSGRLRCEGGWNPWDEGNDGASRRSTRRRSWRC